MTSRLPAGVLLPVLALSLSPLGAADPAVRSLVQKFTEKQAAQATPLPAPAPSARTLTQPTTAPATLAPEATKPGGRKPSPPLASLPEPNAGGPLRILLVDDDASSNNAGGDTGAVQRSDEIFRALVSKAVGGRAEAWSVEVVKNRENGPAFDRLRAFNVVLWYTGASYGANNDTVGREDEKTLRRYLEETGGAVILVSPGYVNNLVYGQSWDAAEHPFLKEVLAVNGCYGLVERAVRGTVRAHDGTEFPVERAGATETQFSVVNPDGAAIVFTSPLETAYAKAEGGGGLPVAVANAYGSGRIVYVGFTFENIPEQEREKAFETLLGAARGAGSVALASTPPVPPTRVPVAIAPKVATLKLPPAAPPGPPPEKLAAGPDFQKSPDQHFVTWRFPMPLAEGLQGPTVTFEVFRRRSSGWELAVILNAKGTGRRVSESNTYYNAWHYSDYVFLPLGSAYKVVSVYSDGRRGEASVEYPTPPQPQLPAGVSGKQISPDTVRIEWLAGPQECVVFGPRLPPNGQACRGVTFWDIGGLPTGVHEFRVALEYARNVENANGQLVTLRNVAPNYRTVRVGVNVVAPP
jgi:hypothetical protein